MKWYRFGKTSVSPTRYGTILVDTDDLPMIEQFSWHVRAGTHFYVRAWVDSRRASADRGKCFYLHDMLMMPADGREVDFRNGNGLDCRRANMRLTGRFGNCCNRRVTHSSSGFLGVGFDKARGKWKAQIRKDGRNYMLGRFDSLRDAIIARETAAEEMHGEFASTLNQELLDRQRPAVEMAGRALSRCSTD